MEAPGLSFRGFFLIADLRLQIADYRSQKGSGFRLERSDNPDPSGVQGAGIRVWDGATQGDARVLVDFAPLGLGSVDGFGIQAPTGRHQIMLGDALR